MTLSRSETPEGLARKIIPAMATGKIYFHSPCFDGIVSAVLVWDFLEKRDGWVSLVLRAVNYDKRDSWLRNPLEEPNAVVDFLYHPGAQFWADHHPTTFLTDAARRDFFGKRENQRLIYDPGAGSCAALLWDRLYKLFGHRSDRYRELVEWADKIDSARYSSVEEAMSATVPALRIAKGLGVRRTQGYSESVVGALREKSLAEVAELPEVRARSAEAERLTVLGWDRLKQAVRLEEGGIAVFDVDARDVFISRYGAFGLFPEARYAAGIVRLGDSAKITVMRNPWRDFPCPPLGEIAEKLGGGGHRRIGSISLRGDRIALARSVLNKFLKEMRLAEATVSNQPR